MPKKIVIAVVDDDESVRVALTGLMKSLGYSAVAFACAKEFLTSDQCDQTACLISDVQMPGLSGPELHDILMASGKSIPTILLTAYPDEKLRARVLQAGVRGYLTKPFNEDDLLACLGSALDATGQRL
jgi:FixJ family two-component response regulator